MMMPRAGFFGLASGRSCLRGVQARASSSGCSSGRPT